MKKIIWLLLFCAASQMLAQTCPGPSQRTALINLQRAGVTESTRAGQFPLTDTCGNLRYAQYTEVNLTPIAYTPTSTGNTANLSEFVITPAADVWYIDWQGNAILVYSATMATGDKDFLENDSNLPPDNIQDTMYTKSMTTFGGRVYMPGQDVLIIDSVANADFIVNGFRNAQVSVYDNLSAAYAQLSQIGNESKIVLGENSALFKLQSATGTNPVVPTAPFKTLLQYLEADTSWYLPTYPPLRDDAITPSNFLGTDVGGRVVSLPITSIPGAVQAYVYNDAPGTDPGITPDPVAGPFLAYNESSLEEWFYDMPSGFWVLTSDPSGYFITSSEFTGTAEPGDPLALAQQGATVGQALAWDGTQYVPTTISATVAEPANQVVYGTGTGVDSDPNLKYTASATESQVDLNLTDSTGFNFYGLRPGFSTSSAKAIKLIPSTVPLDISPIPAKFTIGMGKIPGDGVTAADFLYGLTMNMEASAGEGADTSSGGFGLLFESKFRQSLAGKYGTEFHIAGRRKLSLGPQTEQRCMSVFYNHDGTGGQTGYSNTIQNFSRHDGRIYAAFDLTITNSGRFIFVDSIYWQTNTYNFDLWRARNSDGSTFSNGLMKFGRGPVSLQHNRLIFGQGDATGIELNTRTLRLNQGSTINGGGLASPMTFDSSSYYAFNARGTANGIYIFNPTTTPSNLYGIAANAGRWDHYFGSAKFIQVSSGVTDGLIQLGANIRLNTNANSAKLNTGQVGGANNTLVVNYLSANNYGSAAAAGLGTSFLNVAKSSTTDDRQQSRFDSRWVDATDATRTAAIDFWVTSGGSATPNQQALSIVGDGTATALKAKIGINVIAPVRSLDINGEVRINDLVTDTPTDIIGADADGDLAKITLGAGVAITAGALSATNLYNSNGTTGAARTVTLTDYIRWNLTTNAGTGIAPMSIRVGGTAPNLQSWVATSSNDSLVTKFDNSKGFITQSNNNIILQNTDANNGITIDETSASVITTGGVVRNASSRLDATSNVTIAPSNSVVVAQPGCTDLALTQIGTTSGLERQGTSHWVTNFSGGTLTITPFAGESINNSSSATIPDGKSAWIMCIGPGDFALMVGQ